MEQAAIARRLEEALAQMQVIDCHEHLPPEAVRTGRRVDVFTLFSHYTGPDLMVAGMAQADYQKIQDTDLPLDYRWQLFAPYWQQIRWNSYSRAALLAAQRCYGCDDISAATYRKLSEAMQKANTPGIYQRILAETCNIRTSLTQCGRTETGTGLLTPVMPLLYDMESWQGLTRSAAAGGAAIRSLDDYLDACRAYVVRVKGEGAVGLKMASNPYGDPDREKAVEAFRALQEGRQQHLPVPNPLRDFVLDQLLAFAAEQDLVIAVHMGYWGDFRILAPSHMIPLLQRHPRTRFDLYHVGYPYVRESLMLGKAFPNAWLNFCWTHIISQKMAMDALDEAIDLVPSNKVLGFGGDYDKPVEKVYGHLAMAREDIATVLAGRVAQGRWSEEQALAIARQWLWDNPRELYRLQV